MYDFARSLPRRFLPACFSYIWHYKTMIMQKKLRLTAFVAIPASLLLTAWLVFRGGEEKGADLVAEVKQGTFDIRVTTTGELEAKSSENIFGPSGLRSIRIWQVKIEDIIPDGTVVDSGDYVATLDRSEISNRIKDEEAELDKLESQFARTRLDTSLELRNAREELINLEFALEEARIALEQSQFEPPATIRQAQIELDRAQRTFQQARKNYSLKLDKARATMQEVAASLSQTRRRYEQSVEVLKDFTVMAPKAGMVIYKRNWDGSKLGVGATVNAWENVVATLPDLSEMISRTYVNEIDISKVSVGQSVKVSIDAFPDKVFDGRVTEVANIGEQLRNSNAKVFEVKVLLLASDSILRPAMTTQNAILTGSLSDVIHIPADAVHAADSLSFVYMASGRRERREVITGAANENEIVIEKGLAAGEKVYLSIPENAEEFRMVRLGDRSE
jgi:RND family efflux transporter MFP subunit